MLKARLNLLYSLVLIMLFASANANAVNNSWQSLPLACLPERAAPWVNGKPESDQAACHCPPIEKCPSTFEEYSDNSKAQMPMGFVMRCCPSIPAPELCPDGTLKKEGVPCEVPEVAECPTKYYPSLVESKISQNSNYTKKYKDEKGRNFDFEEAMTFNNNWDYNEYDTSDKIIALFSWSIRVASFWGDQEGQKWVNSDKYCNKFGSGVCASVGYRALGNNHTESKDLKGLLKQYNSNLFTWFGISIAEINKLPDNLATPAIVDQYANKRLSFVRVFNAERGDMFGSSKKNRKFEQPEIGLVTAHTNFVEACRSVTGEYVTIEYHDQKVGEKTLSCPYLQCRYVYDTTMESCLEESTEITLADGAKKKIADLKVGDLILNGEGKSSKVKAVNKYQEELRVLYGINGGKPTFTGDHPIKTKAGWKVVTKEATDLMAKMEGFAGKPLAVGDVIVGLDSKEIEVKSIERHAQFEPINTYNLKIEGDNSFVASDMVLKGFDKMEMHY